MSNPRSGLLTPRRGTPGRSPAPNTLNRRRYNAVPRSPTGSHAPSQSQYSYNGRGGTPSVAQSIVNEPVYTQITDQSLVDPALPFGLRSGTVLLSSETHSVRVDGAVPVRVRNELSRLDLGNRQVRVCLDEVSGYVGTSSASGCEVWDYATRSSVPPVANKFSTYDPSLTSSPSSPDIPPPFIQLVSPQNPNTTRRQQIPPGLLLVFVDGAIVFWESVTMAQAAGAKAAHESLGLADGEEVKGVWAIQPGKYFISTSRRLFRLIVRQSQGRHHLHLSTLNLPKSSSWFGGEDSVREVAVGDVGGDGLSGRVAWLLLDRTIQRWSIQGDGEHHQSTYQFSAISESLQADDQFSHQSREIRSSLQVLEISALQNDTILALCCYTSRHSTHYLIVSLKAQSDALTFEHSIKLSHGYPTQLHRLITFPSANIAVVQLSHAAIIVSLARDAGREWAVTLKDEEDVFIGVGRGIGGVVRTLATRAGVLGLEINPEAIRQVLTSESHDTASSNLSSRILQSVQFDQAENPLYFGLRTGYQGDLEMAVNETANTILTKNLLRQGQEQTTRSVLETKREQLQALSKYLIDNRVLDKVSEQTKQVVATYRQIVAVALGWWAHLEKHDRLHTIGEGKPKDLLTSAIVKHMQQRSSLTGGQIETWFSQELTSMVDVLHLVAEIANEQKEAVTADVQKAEWVASCASIFLISYENGIVASVSSIYQELEISSGAEKQFLTDDNTVQSTLALYRQTAEYINQSSDQMDEDAGGRSSGNLPARQKKHISGLAGPLCYAIEKSAIKKDTKTDQRQASALLRQSESSVAEVLSILNRLDPSQALSLAQTHRNHPTLVRLAIEHKNPAAIEQYLDGKFSAGERADADGAGDFARCYFGECERNDRIYDLLNRQPRHRPLLASYLAEEGHHQWAWLNSLSMRDYTNAGKELELVGKDGNETALAMARLCAMAA